MIVEVTVIVHTCPKCESENIDRNGHDYKDAQKYRCNDCGCYGTIVAFVVRDRSEATCRKPWGRIPEAYRNRHTFSDFWEAYQWVFPEATHSSVGKESGQTNHIERWNNTLRQRLARFVRRTLSFSKPDRFHELVLELFIHRYNLNRLQLISQS